MEISGCNESSVCDFCACHACVHNQLFAESNIPHCGRCHGDPMRKCSISVCKNTEIMRSGKK